MCVCVCVCVCVVCVFEVWILVSQLFMFSFLNLSTENARMYIYTTDLFMVLFFLCTCKLACIAGDDMGDFKQHVHVCVVQPCEIIVSTQYIRHQQPIHCNARKTESHANTHTQTHRHTCCTHNTYTYAHAYTQHAVTHTQKHTCTHVIV